MMMSHAFFLSHRLWIILVNCQAARRQTPDFAVEGIGLAWCNSSFYLWAISSLPTIHIGLSDPESYETPPNVYSIVLYFCLGNSTEKVKSNIGIFPTYTHTPGVKRFAKSVFISSFVRQATEKNLKPWQE